MNQRQKKLYEILEQEGEVTIGRLAQLLNVSEMTIYRDAAELEKSDLLFKKRGALVYRETEAISDHYIDEKRAIAQVAASMICEGDTVLFDNSTTALEVARLLSDRKGITVYATNLEVASVLCQNRDIVLYVGGGYYAHDSMGFVGSFAEQFVEQIYADKCIVGTGGIHLKHGLTCPYPAHAALQRKIMAAADEVILVADHTKFGKAAPDRIAGLDAVDKVITDNAVSEEWKEYFGDRLMIAETKE